MFLMFVVKYGRMAQGLVGNEDPGSLTISTPMIDYKPCVSDGALITSKSLCSAFQYNSRFTVKLLTIKRDYVKQLSETPNPVGPQCTLGGLGFRSRT